MCSASLPSAISTRLRSPVAKNSALLWPGLSSPLLILTGEPTSNLDSKSSRAVIDSFAQARAALGATIFMVTHDSFAASFASRILFIKDGTVFNEIRRGDTSRADFFNRIMEVVTFLGGDVRDAG